MAGTAGNLSSDAQLAAAMTNNAAITAIVKDHNRFKSIGEPIVVMDIVVFGSGTPRIMASTTRHSIIWRASCSSEYSSGIANAGFSALALYLVAWLALNTIAMLRFGFLCIRGLAASPAFHHENRCQPLTSKASRPPMNFRSDYSALFKSAESDLGPTIAEPRTSATSDLARKTSHPMARTE
jgi:hypothetical protein